MKEFDEMLESYLNGNRNEHRKEFWMMDKEEQMEYFKYCLGSLGKEEFLDLLTNLSVGLR